MLAVLERQIDRAADSMRFASGEDHLELCPAIVDTVARLPVLLDGFDEILDDQNVAHAESAVVERFRFSHAFAGDRLPARARAARGTVVFTCRGRKRNWQMVPAECTLRDMRPGV